ncbi:AI-2E family transporter [Novipirellula sp.]|uniref:AI-2E family transporter n=1 Tax=Novipirellula sp. TaxID=2795430 RepID=UPI0035633849
MGIQSADKTSRWLPPLAIAVLATIAVAALYLGQVIFIPLALGIILSFLLQPIVRLLERGGLPRVPSVVTVVLLISIVLAGIGWSVGGQLRDLAHDLRANQTYISNLESKIFDLRRLLGSGAMADLQATLERVGTRLEEVEGDAQNKTKVNETKVLVQAERNVSTTVRQLFDSC